jgi:hypothetical protein
VTTLIAIQEIVDNLTITGAESWRVTCWRRSSDRSGPTGSVRV